jgi:hypothetical protein
MRTLTICQSWLFSRQDLIFFFPHQKLEQALPYNLKKRLLHVNSLPRQGIVDEHATLTLTNKFKKKNYQSESNFAAKLPLYKPLAPRIRLLFQHRSSFLFLSAFAAITLVVTNHVVAKKALGFQSN